MDVIQHSRRQMRKKILADQSEIGSHDAAE
jgi:hypothetical protein